MQTTTTQTEWSGRPVFDPRVIAVTHQPIDNDGNIRYNILADGLCIEDSVCKPWELSLRVELLVENMFRVC